LAKWWRRRRVEQRQIEWPYDVGPPAYALGGTTSVDRALSLSPVYAAVTLLADSVASLPLQIYRRSGDRTQRVMSASLLDEPSPGQSLYDWLHACMTSLLLWGNAYGYITSRDGWQFPTSVVWMAPQRMRCEDANDSPRGCRYFYDGREIPANEIVHIRAAVLPGRSGGISPLEAFSGLITSSLATQAYGADWMTAGGFPPGIMKNTRKELTPTSAEEIKKKTVRAVRSREPLVVGMDWDYTPIAVPPEQAQFIQTMQLNATQIAAIYRVPPERIGGGVAGGTVTYANQVQDEIAFQNVSVRPWCTRLESALFGLFPERQFVRFNMDAAIRTDLKTRHEIYQIDRAIGFASIDDLRAIDDLPPLPNGEGARYAPLGSASKSPSDSAAEAARMLQQIYLSIGKVVTVDEARRLVEAVSGIALASVDADHMFADLPPLPTPIVPPTST
jgi:HK97 family phage portal protein